MLEGVRPELLRIADLVSEEFQVNSRERLLTALNHQEADRIPIDLASTQVTGISVLTYQKLRDTLGLPVMDPVICDRIQQICLPHDDVLDRFGIDTRGLWPLMNHVDFVGRDEGEYLTHVDDWSLIYRIRKEGALWYDLFQSPLESQTLSGKLIEQFPWPKGNSRHRIEGLKEQALAIRSAGYPVVLKSICAGLFEMMIRIRGMENAMMDLLMDPLNSELLLDQILKHKLDYWEMALTELGDLVDVVAEGDDFGTQASQLISIDTWRSLIKPRQAELIKSMKQKAPHAKVFFHSCGNVHDYLEEFIDMGIDILNPVHITATGMRPDQLKKDFGKDIVFWGGGIDTQGTLPSETPAQVAGEVRRNIEILGDEGGYVFNTIHNIQADVPPDNIVAMYETVLAYGKY